MFGSCRNHLVRGQSCLAAHAKSAYYCRFYVYGKEPSSELDKVVRRPTSFQADHQAKIAVFFVQS